MEPKPFWQRTEFILTALATIGAIFLPDFPKESLLMVGTYLISRVFSKEGGVAAKAGVKTSEFWVTAISGPLFYLFPDMPKEQVALLVAYVGGMGWKKRGTTTPVPTSI